MSSPTRAEPKIETAGPVDPEHRLEAAQELGGDQRDVGGEVLVRPLEDAPVVQRHR